MVSVKEGFDGTTAEVTLEARETQTGLSLTCTQDNEEKSCIHIGSMEALSPALKSQLGAMLDVGDQLVSVNDHEVLDEDFEDTIAFLDMLRMSELQRKLKFLRIGRGCTIDTYRSNMSSKSYKKDSFGFSHNAIIVNAERYREQRKATSLRERDMIFLEFLKSKGGPKNLKPVGVFTPSVELKKIVRAGIPLAFRPVVWTNISLASLNKTRLPVDYYQKCVEKCDQEKYGEKYLDKRVIEDIEKDVDRTFPNHDYFLEGGEGIARLRRLLQAYAVHNPDVGYCQAMNYIAGTMLLYMDEDDAFYLFLTMLDTLLPADYYTSTMVGVYVDMKVLDALLLLYLPKVHALLTEKCIDLALICMQWFVCGFINTLSHEVALRVWDVFFNEGAEIFFRVALALFKFHEEAILGAIDSNRMFTVLQDIGNCCPLCSDADLLLRTAFGEDGGFGAVLAAVKLPTIPSMKMPNMMNDFSKQLSGMANPFGSVKGSSRKTSGSGIVNRAPTVPHQLQGLGLAHTGPTTIRTEAPPSDKETQEMGSKGPASDISGALSTSSEPLETTYSDFRDSSEDANMTPAEHIRYLSLKKGNMTPDATVATPILPQYRETYFSPRNNRMSGSGSEADTTSPRNRSGSGSVIGALTTSFQPSRRRWLRQLRRKDIERLRDQYRPELLEKYVEMERLRMSSVTRSYPSLRLTQVLVEEDSDENNAVEWYTEEEEDGDKNTMSNEVRDVRAAATVTAAVQDYVDKTQRERERICSNEKETATATLADAEELNEEDGTSHGSRSSVATLNEHRETIITDALDTGNVDSSEDSDDSIDHGFRAQMQGAPIDHFEVQSGNEEAQEEERRAQERLRSHEKRLNRERGGSVEAFIDDALMGVSRFFSFKKETTKQAIVIYL